MTRRKRPVVGEASAPAARPADSFAEFVYSVLDEKRAGDIVWLDVSAITDLADDFLIATIQNQRQGAAIVEACEKERKRRGLGMQLVGVEEVNERLEIASCNPADLTAHPGDGPGREERVAVVRGYGPTQSGRERPGDRQGERQEEQGACPLAIED